jgi:hypothetical protein
MGGGLPASLPLWRGIDWQVSNPAAQAPRKHQAFGFLLVQVPVHAAWVGVLCVRPEKIPGRFVLQIAMRMVWI